VSISLAYTKAFATTIAPVGIEELLVNAEYVAIVSIVNGRKVSDATPEECGTSYVAQVRESFKGNIAGRIEFGYSDGLHANARYVVFLSKPGTVFTKLQSTNSSSQRWMAERWKRCSPLQHGPRLMQEGALRLERVGKSGNEIGVKARFPFLLPDSLPFTVDTNDPSITWIRERDLGEHLRNFAKSKLQPTDGSSQ